MTKSEYLARFSLAARWRLSYQEAEEAVSDYEELFIQSGKPDETVCQELGNPVSAARLLGSLAAYGGWLATFFALTLAIAVPLYLLLDDYLLQSFLPFFPDVHSYTLLSMAAAAFLLSLLWFRPNKKFKEKKMSKAIVLTLCLLLAVAAAMAGTSARFLILVYSARISVPFSRLIALLLTGAGGFFASVGIYAIVKSRIDDRRWRSVYILGLTLLLICVFFLDLLVSIDISPADSVSFLSVQAFLAEEFESYALLGSAGVLGAGISLC